jgi:ribosomal protein L29
MKIKEIKNKTAPDLSKLLTDKREALRVFRFGTTGAKTKNVKEGRELKKDIARIMTVLGSLNKAE